MSGEDEQRSVVILYMSVGAGHRIAAEALASALRRCAPEIAVRTGDAIQIAGSPLMQRVPALYPWLMGRCPQLYDRLWHSRRIARLSSRLGQRFGSRPERAVQKFLAAQNSAAVITTHGWACQLVAAARATDVVGCHVGIPTDFGMHPYWPLENVDHYVVSTRQARDCLIRDGFPAECIHVLGIPLRLAFAHTDGEGPAADQGTGKDMPTVLMIAGASGTGYYQRAFGEIRGLLQRAAQDGAPFRAVVVTGCEGPPRAALQQAAEGFPWPVEILGLVKNMHELMAQADLLVTKPGGLIVAEGLAKGLPMALIGPSAGQERANTEVLVDEDVAVEVTARGSLGRQIKRLLTPAHRLAAMAERARALGHPNSAMNVAELIQAVVSGR